MIWMGLVVGHDELGLGNPPGKALSFSVGEPPKVLFDGRQLVFNWYPVVVCRARSVALENLAFSRRAKKNPPTLSDNKSLIRKALLT